MRILQIGGGQKSGGWGSCKLEVDRCQCGVGQKGFCPWRTSPGMTPLWRTDFIHFYNFFTPILHFVYIRTKDNCSDDIRAGPSICMITRFVGSQSRVLTINTPPLRASPSSPSTTQKAGRAQVCELHDKHDHSSLKTSARACFTWQRVNVVEERVTLLGSGVRVVAKTAWLTAS